MKDLGAKVEVVRCACGALKLCVEPEHGKFDGEKFAYHVPEKALPILAVIFLQECVVRGLNAAVEKLLAENKQVRREQ